jgi:hypothetical protein
MGVVNWDDAPEGAEFYGCQVFWKMDNGELKYCSHDTGIWNRSLATRDECFDMKDYCERPQQWPETDERINSIGRNRTEEDMGHYNRNSHEKKPVD